MHTEQEILADLDVALSKLDEHEGYVGTFTKHEALGALPNGTRVEKVWEDPDGKDAHAIGAQATVLGSVHHPDLGIAYFVEWDEHPKRAVLVTAKKVNKAKLQ